MLDVLCECLDQNALPQVWVLELSGFQLHSSVSFNLMWQQCSMSHKDHLDWHGEMKTIAMTKAKIFGTTTLQVLNRDDALVMSMLKPGNQDYLSFGVDAPKMMVNLVCSTKGHGLVSACELS